MVRLDVPDIDWLTMTTFNHRIGEMWAAGIRKNAQKAIRYSAGVRRLQYKGDALDDIDGSIFVGKGEQGKHSHYMMTVSGRLAGKIIKGGTGSLYGFLLRDGGGGWLPEVNCTRIDVQITSLDKSIQGEGGGSIDFQKTVFDAGQKLGKTMSWFQDGAGKGAIATVAVNSRKSDTYYRIYPKKTNEGHAIRFEMEYKKEKAGRVYTSICDGGVLKMCEILKYQLGKLGNDELKLMFYGSLQGCSALFPSKTVEDGASNTEMWLLTVVLPSLVRTLAVSNRSAVVARAFYDAVKDKIHVGGVEETDWSTLVDTEGEKV